MQTFSLKLGCLQDWNFDLLNVVVSFLVFEFIVFFCFVLDGLPKKYIYIYIYFIIFLNVEILQNYFFGKWYELLMWIFLHQKYSN